jgi:hypothetical protein
VPLGHHLAGVWILHAVPRRMPTWRMAISVAAVLLLLTPLTRAPVLTTGLIVLVLLAANVATTGILATADSA